MPFPDLAKQHASFIAAHVFGETIKYKPGGAAIWQSMQAIVTRRNPDPFGAVLANRVDVFVSRADVPEPRVGEDMIQLPVDQDFGEALASYRVEEILSESAGGYDLRAIK